MTAKASQYVIVQAKAVKAVADKYVGEMLVEMRRQSAALERIADALERIEQDGIPEHGRIR
jgi:hypothetical protein